MLTMVWMPKIAEYTGISYSVYFVLFGFILYSILPEQLPNPLPQNNETLTLHLTELIVIISLMGTGIKIDRAFSLKGWKSPLKLVTITMLLCIAAAALLGYYFLGMTLASAMLLGAVLAPTDPVLAADVQVGPPNEEKTIETKFALTSEAGLNDGVAFPFVWLAITIGMMAAGKDTNLASWFAYDVLYRIISGSIVGYVLGKGIGYLIFKIAKRFKVLKSRDGMLAIAATLLVYGITEAIHGYGFIAVFICALALRYSEKEHDYHEELHSFADQIERLLLCILLIIFGGALAIGILDYVTWKIFAFALLFIFVIRPVFGYLSFVRSKIDIREKLAIGFFGIRGMGSIFYLAFGLHEFDFEHKNELWSLIALIILLSVIVHGFTANPVMKTLLWTIPPKKNKD